MQTDLLLHEREQFYIDLGALHEGQAQVAAAERQRVEIAPHIVAADNIQHHVHTASVGGRAAGLHEIDVVIADRFDRAPVLSTWRACLWARR